MLPFLENLAADSVACIHMVCGTMVQVLLRYPAIDLLHCKSTNGPSQDRREMAMASVRGPDAFSVAVWTFLFQLNSCMV